MGELVLIYLYLSYSESSNNCLKHLIVGPACCSLHFKYFYLLSWLAKAKDASLEVPEDQGVDAVWKNANLETWNQCIGHLEYALKMSKLVLKRDMMEAILQKLLESSWLQCTLAVLTLHSLKVLHFQVSKV